MKPKEVGREAQMRARKKRELSDKIRSQMGGELTKAKDKELDRLARGMLEELEEPNDDQELEEPNDVQELAEKKKQDKPQAIAGNRHHLGGSARGVPASKAGQFTTADKAHSESIGMWTKPKPGTIQGRWRRSGRGREKRWTDIQCGRVDREGNRKHAKRCSAKEARDREFESVLERVLLEAFQSFMTTLVEEDRRLTESGGTCMTFAQVLKSIDAAVRASKGELQKAK